MKTRIVIYGIGFLFWPIVFIMVLGTYKSYINPALWQTLTQPPFAAVHHRVMKVAGWWEGPAEGWQLEKQSTEQSLALPDLPADVRAELRQRHDHAVSSLRHGYFIGLLLITGSYIVLILIAELARLVRRIRGDGIPPFRRRNHAPAGGT